VNLALLVGLPTLTRTCSHFFSHPLFFIMLDWGKKKKGYSKASFQLTKNVFVSMVGVFCCWNHSVCFFLFQDPEFPQTLEELNVIEEDFITIDPIGKDEYNIKIEFKPTVPHCSLATLIGESVKYVVVYSLLCFCAAICFGYLKINNCRKAWNVLEKVSKYDCLVN